MRSYITPINWPEFDAMFNQFYRNDVKNTEPTNDQTWKPQVNAMELDSSYLIEVELPGVDQKDVDIIYNEGKLTIKGEKLKHASSEDRSHHWSERRFGKFERTFYIGQTVDADKISATFKEGMLTITMDKRPELQPKQIEIKSS